MPGSLSQTIAYVATIPIIIFLILMLLPLYRLARDRTAIYIVFSKTCFNILEMSLVSIYSIVYYFSPSRLPDYIYQPYVYTMQSALFATFVHFLAMAINRFHAVFMPFSYIHVWNKRNTHFYILFVSLLGISIGPIYIATMPFLGTSLILQSVQYTVLGVSGAIYLAMISKFAIEFYQSKNRQNAPTAANLEKDRILLSLIALLSILPLPFSILISVQQRLWESDSIMGIFFNSLRIGNYALMQCVEEFCLIIFCKDFRTIICKQYEFVCGEKKPPKEVQITVVSTMASTGKLMGSNGNYKQTNNPVLELTARSGWQNQRKGARRRAF